jgi:hypothetical protein
MIEPPPMSEDEQEAKSIHYACAVRVVGLSSGNFALFSRGSVLHGIYPGEALTPELFRSLCELELRDWESSRKAEENYRTGTGPGPQAKSDNPEDIGL